MRTARVCRAKQASPSPRRRGGAPGRDRGDDRPARGLPRGKAAADRDAGVVDHERSDRRVRHRRHRHPRRDRSADAARGRDRGRSDPRPSRPALDRDCKPRFERSLRAGRSRRCRAPRGRSGASRDAAAFASPRHAAGVVVGDSGACRRGPRRGARARDLLDPFGECGRLRRRPRRGPGCPDRTRVGDPRDA